MAQEMPVLPASGQATVDQDIHGINRGDVQGWLGRRCRNLLLAKLASLENGQLEFVDGAFHETFGKTADAVARIQVVSNDFYRRVVTGGALGAAESYLRGEWITDDLVSVFLILARNTETLNQMDSLGRKLFTPVNYVRRLATRNSKTGSRKNIHAHYDLGNDFFRLFLDDTMTYSSAIFPGDGSNLKEASIEKYDRICRKLRLESNHHVVEIGTGWGGFAIHAASNYGCRVTTTTISAEQYNYAVAAVEQAGLSDRVDVLCEDYRNLTGEHDRLVSIEMIEAVGHEFLPDYFEQCSRLLNANGEALIQGITIPDQRYEQYRKSIDFIQRYIFPGGCLPSLGSITDAVKRKTDLQLVSLDDYASHYAKTLAMWRESFLARLPEVRDLGLDDRFIRMWDYYLAYCEAGFRERMTGLVHLHFVKPNVRDADLL